LKLTVLVPTNEADLKRVVALLDSADKLRSEQKRLVELSEKLRKGVLRMLPEATDDSAN